MRVSVAPPFRVLLLACTLPVVACAQITFAFNYTDTNTGFNDPTLGATRRSALQSAANTLASYFSSYPARTVTFDVQTNNSSGALASAGSGAFIVAHSFQSTLAQSVIQTGDNFGYTSQGTISWNFSYDWSYGSTVAANTYDFQSVAMHEITHALGFASFIDASGNGLSGGTTYSIFDQFLTDASGNRLVSSGASYVGGSILSDGVSGDVYFSGANAMAANGGQRVHIYSPAVYLAGSSLSHLDTTYYGTNNYIMTHAVATGPSLRTFSAIELGVLADIGYTVSAVPESSTCVLAAGALALLVVVRRRSV